MFHLRLRYKVSPVSPKYIWNTAKNLFKNNFYSKIKLAHTEHAQFYLQIYKLDREFF